MRGGALQQRLARCGGVAGMGRVSRLRGVGGGDGRFEHLEALGVAASVVAEIAQRRGVRFHPVDVQRSNWDCLVEADGAIRLGLRYVTGLREQVGRAIGSASLRATSHQPPATSHQSPVTSHQFAL